MNIPAVVSNLLQTVAPTLLSSLALPPPLNLIAANIASAALGAFLGHSDAPDAPPPKASPEQVVQAIETHSSDPAMLLALQRAEADLKKYEMDTSIRFAEIDAKNLQSIRDFQVASKLSEKIFSAGERLIMIALIVMGIMIVVLVVAVGWGVEFKNPSLAAAAFGLVGTVVGFINGLAGAVVSFYWGSSQSSKEKSDTIAASVKDLGDQLGKAANRPTPQPTPQAPPPPVAGADQGPATGDSAATGDRAVIEPATPASISLVSQIVRDLVKPHRFVSNGVEWKLTAEGVAVDGMPARSTGGDLSTVADIWLHYGDLCGAAAKRYGVPVELIVATIAVESGGKLDARRNEAALGDQSVGLMQTLVKTARSALGRPQLTPDDLLVPETAILAGTAYIAQQRGNTHFDPPLVAAAYNAGSLRREDADANRWKLVCYPRGTGHHIDKYVNYFCDAMHVSAQADWSKGGQVPSFAFGLGHPDARGDAHPPQARVTAPAPASQRLDYSGEPLDMATLAGNPDLTRALQSRLSELGYLDPPADGKFGEVSGWAYRQFCADNGVADAGSFSADTAALLRSPRRPLSLPRAGSWLDLVVDAMTRANYWIARSPGCVNIVYLEGVNEDGTLNDNRPNVFNDLRLVFWTGADNALAFRAWQGTSEPGAVFTTGDRRNPEGAARIAFGQYKSWAVGIHHAGKPSAHEALVQVEPVTVCRDLNQDFKRDGDRTETGVFGINQHWGYNQPADDIGSASAGCLVGRTEDGHREFMEIVKSDPRYVVSHAYKFLTAVLPGSELRAPPVV